MFQDLLLLAAAATCALATRYGSAPERVLTTAFLGNLLLEEGCAVLIGREFSTEHFSVYFALELSLLILFCAVALRANRVYPLWLGGGQIIAIAAHVLLQVLGREARAACEWIDACASLVQLVALTVGLSAHRSRQLRLGRRYPDWTATANSH
ncbi:hypothetical protein HNO88_002316 [Novosphingobium chloroacetimidivorans]|uniref:Uncharacterized protein n=1 Tax=Novosphingobium chloroacetimidivorans TaxID=1428314 RepID=A0A7W7KAH0_9SPHN|nr:hypothetical protein [Novosphingobium chloroacetimidivorans]MBB4858990.1 hypothetical protein [Novosphingobium chloroacetimidivorans]